MLRLEHNPERIHKDFFECVNGHKDLYWTPYWSRTGEAPITSCRLPKYSRYVVLVKPTCQEFWGPFACVFPCGLSGAATQPLSAEILEMHSD